MIADRLETFILTIIRRTKLLTVFGLIFIRVAISLLVSPSPNKRAVSCSRGVRPNRRETSSIVKCSGDFLSSLRTTTESGLLGLVPAVSGSARQRCTRFADRNWPKLGRVEDCRSSKQDRIFPVS